MEGQPTSIPKTARARHRPGESPDAHAARLLAQMRQIIRASDAWKLQAWDLRP